MRHIISVILENEAGALSRVAGLFSARGFNIESLTVAATTDSTLSRMTIVSVGDDGIIEQIVKQLDKLIDVVKVVDLTATEHIERELLLAKISITSDTQVDVEAKLDQFNAKIIDAAEEVYIVELAGKSQKIKDFLNAFNVEQIIEISRTGVTGVCQKI
ncbi:acetolactate synthase small subunit [Candidatus Thioglobus sp.]|nr:acetolactate synthase small subunit [Candidatus Thioglobus sp.]